MCSIGVLRGVFARPAREPARKIEGKGGLGSVVVMLVFVFVLLLEEVVRRRLK